jgi:hypothetical protein
MHQLNIQLYGRTSKKNFSEQLSVFRSVTLTPEPTKIELPLKAPGRERFVELRLDPDDKPSAFVLHGLHVRTSAGLEIYKWGGSPNDLSNLVDLRARKANDDVLIESESNDPFLLIPFSEPQGGTVVLELSVSQNLVAPDVADAGDAAVSALSTHQQELADAVRSLQGTLRKALDDLAAEQEGLQDALVVHHAYARVEDGAVRQQLSQVLTRTETLEAVLQKATSDLGAMESAFAAALSETARETRNTILSEVRDDWRSLGRQIKDRAEAASKDAGEREAALSASRDAEFARLMTALDRLSNSQHVMEKVRAELGIARDEDAPAKLRQLKAEAQSARAQVEALESSLYWRLTRPFSSLSRKASST